MNDGSRDNTFVILRSLRERDPTISIVNLSRNFGKEIAITAGLDHSRGDAVIVIDADLQDPRELIPILIERWRQDEADVVFARRSSREGKSWFKKPTAFAFYRIINAVSGQTVPVDTGDFRLLSRQAVLSYRGVLVEGAEAEPTELNNVALTTSAVAKDGPCVEWRSLRCIPSNGRIEAIL